MMPIPFEFGGQPIRVIADAKGEPLFVGKDICLALGYANPNKAMADHCRGITKRYPIVDSLGRTQEVRVLSEADMFRLVVNSSLPSAESFERLVFEEILPTIRRSGSYGAPGRAPQLQPVRDLLMIGKAMTKIKGVNESLAMACTLDAIERTTGLPTALLAKALPAVAPSDAATMNATQVGAQLDMSAKAVNVLLEELGLQQRDASRQWGLTDAGAVHGEAKPFHKNGHSGYEIRWKSSVLEELRRHLATLSAY